MAAFNPGDLMLVHQPRQATDWRSELGSVNRRPARGDTFPGLFEPGGATITYSRDVEIYGDGEPAEHFYGVVSGAVRTYKVLLDGRRQICDFYLPGDVFGLETDDSYAFSADAIVSSKILVVNRRLVLAQAERDRDVAQKLWAITGNELKRVQAHIMLLTKTAKERVAAFLLEMAVRMRAGEQVDLPMSRQDIADYLGLTIETVSRTLADLESKELISLPSSRRVVLGNRDVLLRHCG